MVRESSFPKDSVEPASEGVLLTPCSMVNDRILEASESRNLFGVEVTQILETKDGREVRDNFTIDLDI